MASLSVASPAEAEGTADTDTVQLNDTVILVASDGRRVFAKASPKESQRFGKMRPALGNLVGQWYGTVFEITKKALLPLGPSEGMTANERASASLEAELSGAADNRDIVDTNSSQQLSAEDIEGMREEGASGKDIIQSLIEHSETWKHKTSFSQQKWLRRKEQKYAPRLRVLRCEGASVCESYYMKFPERVCNLRPDALAQILAYGNVFAGAQILCMDSCMGVVAASIVERLGGYGRCLNAFAESNPNLDAVNKFNFSPRMLSSLVSFHTSEFGKLATPELPDADLDHSSEAVERKIRDSLATMPDLTKQKLQSLKTEEDKQAFLAAREKRIRRACAKPQPGVIRNWIRAQSDSLIIATAYHPKTVFFELVQWLKPACPFVVFSEYIEPLTEVFRAIQERGIGCKLQLSNSWLRPFQVLPGRTHPVMQMSACSGYILTGIKVLPRREEDRWKFVAPTDRKRQGKTIRVDSSSAEAASEQSSDEARPHKRSRPGGSNAPQSAPKPDFREESAAVATGNDESERG